MVLLQRESPSAERRPVKEGPPSRVQDVVTDEWQR